jgi:L-ectoine synthase
MILDTLDNLRTGDRRIAGPGWESVRMLLAGDGLGFSLHVSTMQPGQTLSLWYKHHLEACFCLQGRGVIRALDGSASGEIFPGRLYVLDNHDRHEIDVLEELVVICVFRPALHGDERHDADGSYELRATTESDKVASPSA